MNRWWIYQRERFPLLAHSLLILVFSASAVTYSIMISEGSREFAWSALALSFLSSLIFFMLLRIADEFKDYEDDLAYRPYRPVPRGLVSLKELGGIGMLIIVVQLAAAIVYQQKLLPYLIFTWIYFALMSKEFFVHEWLKRHALAYLFSHMLIMPLIALYATGFDWIRTDAVPPQNIIFFLALSFVNGIVLEIGRKIRAPESEETGVETYSFLWGAHVAVYAWIATILAALLIVALAGAELDYLVPSLLLGGILSVACISAGLKFLKNMTPESSKKIENMSGIWILMSYLTIGLIPYIWQQ